MMRKLAILFIICLSQISFITLNLKSKSKTQQNFQITCQGIGLYGSRLNAECSQRDGNFKHTSVDLNRCVVNDDGNLRHGGDQFHNACSGCYLEGTVMRCLCKRRDGTDNLSSLDLGSFVTNDDGNLRC